MKNYLNKTTIALSFILFALVFLSFTTQQPAPGKDLYTKNCQRCHGALGTKHFLGAKDLQKSKLDDEETLQIILKGKRLMPAYRKKLSTSELDKIIAYLKILKKQ